jgi:hypothetical protein
MYPTVALCEEFLADPEEHRPIVMCEYTHAMGNSNGKYVMWRQCLTNALLVPLPAFLPFTLCLPKNSRRLQADWPHEWCGFFKKENNTVSMDWTAAHFF